jgi:hypothetical protein
VWLERQLDLVGQIQLCLEHLTAVMAVPSAIMEDRVKEAVVALPLF